MKKAMRLIIKIKIKKTTMMRMMMKMMTLRILRALSGVYKIRLGIYSIR
jgi:hypothetical protein